MLSVIQCKWIAVRTAAFKFKAIAMRYKGKTQFRFAVGAFDQSPAETNQELLPFIFWETLVRLFHSLAERLYKRILQKFGIAWPELYGVWMDSDNRPV